MERSTARRRPTGRGTRAWTLEDQVQIGVVSAPGSGQCSRLLELTSCLPLLFPQKTRPSETRRLPTEGEAHTGPHGDQEADYGGLCALGPL